MIYLLPHTILASANRFPDREAFRCGNNSLTFRQLSAKMSQLAATLIDLGVQKGDRVGIYLNRSIETAIAIYGIMHAGAVYVPLDPKAPIDRILFVIQDCHIKILITNDSQKRNISNIAQSLLPIKGIIGITDIDSVPTFSWEALKNQPTDFQPPFRVLENDLAYILYTSGSTGKPKGIMHTHSSGLNYARLTADLYQVTEQDRIGNHAPIYFDISTLGYFTAPLAGACTVIASDAHTIFPNNLSQLIEKERLTIWYSVPLALMQMLQNGALEKRDMRSLRWVLYAGEPFPPKHLRTLMNIWTHTQFSNVYGPTELNQCTYYTIPRPLLEEEAIPIGEVWGNTEKIIVDETDKEVTATVGELCVRSGTMMKGYWQQPELTEKSFYKRKNNTGSHDIFYRTGDLVQLDEAGLLHFLGRKDHQIKIRGYRVELGGIESTLVNHDAVAEAAVFPIKDNGKVLEIVAAVILKPTVEVTIEALNLYLKDKLPTYAIPKSINIVESFPRTSTGKIKRSKLKEIIYS